LALKSGGIVAWGSNTYNQTNVPVELTSGVTAIAAGGYYSLALKDGGVRFSASPRPTMMRAPSVRFRPKPPTA
jgi:hypothetical protein